MEKTDTRKLKLEALQQLRHQAIGLRKKGMTYKSISEVIDVHYSTICGWWKSYEKEGVKGIRLKTRGRKHGTQRTLNPEQEKGTPKNNRRQRAGSIKAAICLMDTESYSGNNQKTLPD